MTRSTCFVGLVALAAGCARPQPTPVAADPPKVVVDAPVAREVTDYEDFTGRTEAVKAVDVRSRVTGYLDAIHFKDGANVKKGNLLFEIDARPYQSELDRTEAALALAQAHFARLTKDFERAESLKGTISRQEFDQITGDRAEAEASVGVAKAARKLARDNMTYTRITAQHDGRLSRRMIDPGNIVKADETILTNLVALDPIYANFDVDTPTVLRVRRLIQEGKATSARDAEPGHEMEVEVRLPDDDQVALTGKVNFIDSRVDPGTSTLRVRAVVDNGKLLLSPGMFVRVRVPIGRPHRAVLVPEEAIGTDQGQKYVFVVTAKDAVEYRRVKLGSPFGHLRVVTPDPEAADQVTGVTEADRVIVSGLQRVRPGVKVTPQPAPKKGATAAPAAVAAR